MKKNSENVIKNKIFEKEKIVEVEGLEIKAILLPNGIISFETDEFLQEGK